MRFKFISKENISRLPKSAGVYAFKKGAKLLYIGKAVNLRERVKNHSQQSGFRNNLFIQQTKKIGFIRTDSEIEALILEANLIKKYQPKYNVMWRDDKNYFYVGITNENFPRIFITHQPHFKTYKLINLKTKFIGPFVEGQALKQTLNVLRRVFPFRTCKPYSGKPCLWYQLGRCPGPCVLSSKLAKELPELEKAIEKESQANVRNLKKFLEGKKTEVLKNLEREMKNASRIRNYEKGAKIRDQIKALERVMEHARVFEAKPESNDWLKSSRTLKKILKTKKSISRIEAYDVSNIQGQNATGSMVAFINGVPDKNSYRRFRIKISGKPDDVAMLKEVLTRRFSHPEWGWPDLILIDGGKAQLNVAVSSIKCKISGIKIPVLAIAKRENELFIERKEGPVLLKNLPRDIFNLILQLRDEAHRFALSYHKKLREVDLLGKL